MTRTNKDFLAVNGIGFAANVLNELVPNHSAASWFLRTTSCVCNAVSVGMAYKADDIVVTNLSSLALFLETSAMCLGYTNRLCIPSFVASGLNIGRGLKGKKKNDTSAPV